MKKFTPDASPSQPSPKGDRTRRGPLYVLATGGVAVALVACTGNSSPKQSPQPAAETPVPADALPEVPTFPLSTVPASESTPPVSVEPFVLPASGTSAVAPTTKARVAPQTTTTRNPEATRSRTDKEVIAVLEAMKKHPAGQELNVLSVTLTVNKGAQVRSQPSEKGAPAYFEEPLDGIMRPLVAVINRKTWICWNDINSYSTRCLEESQAAPFMEALVDNPDGTASTERYRIGAYKSETATVINDDDNGLAFANTSSGPAYVAARIADAEPKEFPK